MKNPHRTMMLIAGLALLAGCGKKPEGQVIATVNGDEITRQQLNMLIRDSGSASAAQRKQRQNEALSQLINRELLVEAAKERKIDKSPEYLAAVRQASDSIAIQLLQQQIAQSVHTPLDLDVSRYVAENPTRFERREILTVDQIRAPESVLRTGWFAAAKSLDDVTAGLRQNGIQFERATRELDTISMPQPILAQMLAAGQEPFGLASGGIATIVTVLKRTPAPLIGDDAQSAGLALMRKQSAEEALQRTLTALKAQAKIDYQNGFGPPAPARK